MWGCRIVAPLPMADFRNLASFLDKVNTQEVAISPPHDTSLILHLAAEMWFFTYKQAAAKYAEFQ